MKPIHHHFCDNLLALEHLHDEDILGVLANGTECKSVSVDSNRVASPVIATSPMTTYGMLVPRTSWHGLGYRLHASLSPILLMILEKLTLPSSFVRISFLFFGWYVYDLNFF